MTNITIGKLAKQAGMGVETLRYYERRGLITPRHRTQAGYRLYEPDAIRRLRFIRRAQTLGFTLEEIGDLLAFSDDPDASAGDVKAMTQAKVEDIDRRILDLERMKQALVGLAEGCPGHRATTVDCPILAALNRDEQ
jgi:Cu(I)-responsive transcriptional regulator